MRTCRGQGNQYNAAILGRTTPLHQAGFAIEMPLLPGHGTKVEKLVGGFRTASRVVLTSSLGPLVLVVTHQDGDPESGTLPIADDSSEGNDSAGEAPARRTPRQGS